MSFTDDYLKLRKKRLEEQQKQQKNAPFVFESGPYQNATLTADDIAPVKNQNTVVIDDARDIGKKNTGSGLFKAGTFADGYQFGDITKAKLGTVADVVLGIVQGVAGIGEGLGDLAMYGVAGVQDLVGNDDDAERLRKATQEDIIAPLFDSLRKKTNIDDTSLLGDFGYGIAQGVGQVGAIIATGGAGSAAGLGTVGTSALTTGMIGASSMGSGMSEAYKSGATDEEALAYGAMSGVIDAGTEMIFGGLGKSVKAIGVSKGISSLDDVFAKKISSKISNQFFKNATEYGVKAGAEGVEEFLAGIGSAAAKKLTYMSEEDLQKLVEDENLLEQFVAGTIVSGIAQSGDLVKSTKQGRDFITNFSANEETVIEKVYNDRVAEAEQDGTKLTNKKKNKLYEQVQEDMRKGYISTDDIESVLGGETYKSYKDTIDSEDAILKEFDELGKKQNATLAEQSRYAELQAQVKEIKSNSNRNNLKSQLSEEVYNSVKEKDFYLAESYNEKARRGTAFEADLSHYDDKTAETVKRAIDSGILNNTRRTHEFVDMVAKISADKGVLFDFTNNQKLKESGFAVNGASINGYVTKDGITVNISSSKATNSIVGHEITHVLEGTELYAEMQKTLFEYSKSKNDYDSRRKALEELYKNVEGADIDAELTADLVGDYLFTDADFINNLSTKHRNVFQKIYDEIKYLLKIATKGSKEARELEKVKRAFDKAYRESGKTSEGTKYSLSDSDGKQLTKEQSEYFKDSKMRDDNGNLKVMYHGSQDAGFHVFDANMSDDDTSFFFVDRNDVAASYSGTSETYEAQTIRTAEDMNNFIESIGVDGYEVVEKDGKFTLLYEGDRIADSNTAKGIYEEFCWYEGVGEGDANYKVYLNLTNPLEVDAEGRNWNNISREFSQEVYGRYKSLTAEEKAALSNLAEWGEYSIFRDEMLEARATAEQGGSGVFDEAYTKNLARAYEKLGGANANLYDAYSIAQENFSEESLKEFAVKQMNTRDYARKAKAEGYDGVIFKNIHDNGGFSNGSEGASTVAIAFESNQIKSVANEKPTGNADIRYSLSEGEQADNGVKVMDGGSVTKYSLSTWTPETQTKVRENLIKSGYDAERVDKWIKDTNSVASVIAADKARLDFVAADNQVMLKDNQEYIKTLDASTLCAKRLVYQGTFDAIQHRLPNTMLSSDDLIDLLNMMKEHGVQTPCGVCYVESRRRHLGKFAQGWLDSYNGEYKPNLDEVTTSDGLEALRKSHPQTYKDFVDAMNKKGSSNPKVVQLRTEYRNEIMSLTPKQIRDIEAIGGLRVQSFSDFETPHLLDMMQAVMDMSAKGLHSQAYTKVPNFAWVFGDTGIKINLSLIAEGDGFDANGNLVFSSTEGMDIDEAMKLRDAYSQNVGTIIVGANDKHILACMADDRIDFIIPFHRSGWGMKELEMMGMSSYTDYTYGQKEHDLATGKGVANLYPADYWDYTLNGKENAERYLNLCAKIGREPKFSKFLVNNGDGSYSLQPDGSTDGYWKTLIDFKMYDNEGNGAAQQKVQPNFNMEEAYRVLGEYEGNANKLPIANDVVEEFVAKYHSYQDLAPAMSLSAEGETSKRYGNYNVFGKDIKLEAPIQEDVAPMPSEPPKVATILTEEPEVPKKKNRAFTQARTNLLDKGSVFEDLSLKTGNRELQGKYNFMHYSEARAQKHIADNLKPLVKKAEQLGKSEQLYEYVYHLHNIDRMSLETEENRVKREALREKFKGYSDKQIERIAMEWIKHDTPKDVVERIKAAREYIEASKGKNKPVFGDTVTADVSRDVVRKLEAENPEFKELSKEIVEYNAGLRQMLVDAGVISQETADLWAKMYPHYVPIRRLGDEGLSVNVPLDTNKTGVNAPIKRATGGNRNIMPLFDTMAMRTEQTFKAIAKNNFGTELMHTLDSTVESNATSLDDVIDSFDNHEELLQEGKNGKNPTFTVFENGKRVTFEITEDMYDALKPTSKGLSYTNKVANTASNIFRGILTEYNPVFMVSNAAKDIQDVLINSQHAAKTYANIPRALKELTTKGRWYTEYMENGGEQNTYFDSESKTFKEENKGFIKTIGMPLRAISTANNFIERIPRLAEYIASREAGASVEVAMLDAARVNTNFAAGGDVTKFLNRNGATFLNASVQGFNQNVRNVREAKANGLKGWVKLTAKVALAGVPALLLNNLLWDDDEEYEELSEYVKDNYYVVAKTEDGKFIRIPKGRVFAVIQDAFEQMENAVTGNDEVDFKNFFNLVISNLAPNNPIENNILAPIIQVANNKTWYGEDLVPTRLQDLPAGEQYDESTDAFSKWLGEKTNISPYKLNYLLNQYSGGVGDVFLPMLTPEAESGDNSFKGNILAPMKDKFTTDSTLNNKNVSAFYDTMDELTTNAKSSKATDEDILKYKYFNSINAELSELYAQKREIQNSDLANDEKYEAVRELQEQINDLARESLNTYENVYISDGYASIGDIHYRWYEPGEDSDAEAGWQKITDKQLEKQEAVTSYLGVEPSEYWKNKTEYDFAYEYPEKYSVAKSVGGYSAYKRYTSELYDIKADKDKYGKSISGSRKEKIIEYVNNLDIDYGARLILFKSEYNADDTYNYDIIDYLNNRQDISYEEMETILKELGFTVRSDGTIQWD